MVSENVIILTREESIEVQREEVRRVYNMSLEDTAARVRREPSRASQMPRGTTWRCLLGDDLVNSPEWREMDWD